MQDRYTGDLGDFSKLGILRALQAAGLSIGVNWYLTPDESHNGDGRHVKYLRQEEFKACDKVLWQELKILWTVITGKSAAWRMRTYYQHVFIQSDLTFQGRLKLKESLSARNGTKKRSLF